MQPRTLHVDMDAFFASVEVLKDPALRGKPVAVGHDGPRGVVASASYETRKFGVSSGMPSSRARRLCPEMIFLRGDMSLYAAYSGKVLKILQHFSPRVAPASIDEFYLDLSGCERLHGNFFDMAGQAFSLIRDELGLTASMGLASGWTLAKVAAKVAKPRGVVEVVEGEEEGFMAPLPVGMIPGVGPSAGRVLSKMGVRTAGELASIPPVLMEKAFGAHGLEWHLKARGLWPGLPSAERRGPRSIGHETTFAEDIIDPDLLRGVLFTLVEKSARRLRGKGLEAGRVTVKVRYSDFATVTRTKKVDKTALDQEIFRRAGELLDGAVKRRLRVRLIGVSLSELRPAGHQGDLFGEGYGSRRMEACLCLDRIKERFGRRAARWAAGMAPGHRK